jgi:ATP-binding cassette, subfamily B, bacterial
VKTFPTYRQPDAMDCGPTCLRMVVKFYGRSISLPKLRAISETTREGSSLQNLADAAEYIGFRSLGVKISFNDLRDDAPLPCIVFWQQRHFVVVYKVKKDKVFVADPAFGLVTYTKEDFIKNWIGDKVGDDTEEGIALLLEPTPKLSAVEEDDNSGKKAGFGFLFQYVFRYKKFITQLIIGLLAGSVLQLIFPFLTQSVVDIGIQNQDIHFVYLILMAQLFLFIGSTSIELIRGWILLHLSSRINISLISDFFIKLMSLPIAFFDVKMTGDIIQRIRDHQRIEELLTSTSLNTLFSLVNLVVFGAVLAWYDWWIFALFFIGSLLYFLWIILFLKKRRELDFKQFSQVVDEQNKMIELIQGMQEIKLHNAEKQKRWGWEFLQAKLLKISIKRLSHQQTQTTGARFINEAKNILITAFAAKLVIDGNITLGMMLAISYIIGQLNGPINQLITFIYTVQDAKIALERLGEIHNKEDEEENPEGKIHELPENRTIEINNLHFRYTGSDEEVLKGISMSIPVNKMTAIVGSSGSGKTTLMKMLLKFYEPTSGEIRIGGNQLIAISHKLWRAKSGVVMQEGYIFNDTIARNIAVGEDIIDKDRLKRAVTVANIQSYVEQLPLGYNTKIGQDGVGMSGGQKQRILIARAVYKNPDFIFFDEATSALDANNEKIIMENLDAFFKGRTAVVIAHRLSTVKNADQIVVLEHGEIIEKGTHDALIQLKGRYFYLVKNQLELGG